MGSLIRFGSSFLIIFLFIQRGENIGEESENFGTITTLDESIDGSGADDITLVLPSLKEEFQSEQTETTDSDGLLSENDNMESLPKMHLDEALIQQFSESETMEPGKIFYLFIFYLYLNLLFIFFSQISDYSD